MDLRVFREGWPFVGLVGYVGACVDMFVSVSFPQPLLDTKNIVSKLKKLTFPTFCLFIDIIKTINGSVGFQLIQPYGSAIISRGVR